MEVYKISFNKFWCYRIFFCNIGNDWLQMFKKLRWKCISNSVNEQKYNSNMIMVPTVSIFWNNEHPLLTSLQFKNHFVKVYDWHQACIFVFKWKIMTYVFEKVRFKKWDYIVGNNDKKLTTDILKIGPKIKFQLHLHL